MSDDPTVTASEAGPPAGPADAAVGADPAAGAEPAVAPWGPDGPAAERPDGTDARPRHRRGRLLLEWGVVLVVALVVAVCVRTFVFETFFIPSGSMETTLGIGDRIVVDKLSFDLHPVYVGDIVVFERPPSWPREYADLVKRVIGLPGETLWIHDGNVFIDPGACRGTSRCTGPDVTDPTTGQAFRELAEPWLPAQDRNVTTPEALGSPTDLKTPYTVPAGEYFVMGDNRTFSADSRFYGPVPRTDLVGQVVWRYWPLNRFGSL